MKYGIVALTKGAAATGAKILAATGDAVFYVKPVFYKETDPHYALIDEPWNEFTGRVFKQHRVLIFIMAAGIVVRSLAPWLEDKTCDPAVLVVDEAGRFVISLLSGHLGGANLETELLAAKIGAVPVITTASDVNGKLAVDQLALKYNCVIEDLQMAKKITAMIVNNRKVLLMSDFAAPVIPAYLKPPPETAEAVIRISCSLSEPGKQPCVTLFPRFIVAGIGCRKDTPPDRILSFLKETLDNLCIDRRCLKSLATITLKQDNLGPVAAALGVPLTLFLPAEIAEVEHLFAGSDFVQRSVGVSCVCEPAAYLGSDRTGRMLSPKQQYSGITLALWQETFMEAL